MSYIEGNFGCIKHSDRMMLYVVQACGSMRRYRNGSIYGALARVFTVMSSKSGSREEVACGESV